MIFASYSERTKPRPSPGAASRCGRAAKRTGPCEESKQQWIAERNPTTKDK
jgi:hypothetical protein